MEENKKKKQRVIKLLSALDENGNAVLIDKVERKGLKCNCYCPGCKERLVAILGTKYRHHFAHSSNSKCNYNFISSLHLSAQEMLKECKYIFVPPENSLSRQSNEWIKINIDDVILEHRENGYIPDVTIISGNKKILVEIFVKHQVDCVKVAKLYVDNVSTLEIDLSDQDMNDFDNSVLRNILICPNKHKYWLYNSNIHKDNCDLVSMSVTEEPFTYTKIEKSSNIEETSKFVNCPIGKIVDRYGYSYAKADRDCIDCPFNLLQRQDYKDIIEKEEKIIYQIKVTLEPDKANELIQRFNRVRLGTFQCNGYCRCLGRYLIGEPEDVPIALNENKKYMMELESKYYRYLHNGLRELRDMQCPICKKGHLQFDINERDHNEIFVGCSRYLDGCRFTIKPKEMENILNDIYSHRGKRYPFYKNAMFNNVCYTRYIK